MTTMNLLRVVSGPTYVAGHIMDLFFCAGPRKGDLAMEELFIALLPVGFKCTGTSTPHRVGGRL